MIGTVASEMTLLTTVGLPNRPSMRRQRRLGADHAALAFEAFQQRRFLRRRCRRRRPRALRGRKCLPQPEDVRRDSRLPGRGDRLLQRRERVRIFGADIDVALVAPDREAGDRHAFDQHERIAFHDHAVGEGAAVAFVGVADDVFLLGRGVGDGLPLDAGREARAAAAAQARLGHRVDDAGGAERQRCSGRDSRRAPDSRRATADR